MRRRTIAITTLSLAVQALGPVATARAAAPVVATFVYTGAEQSWVVPSGVGSIHVALVGGRGGLGSSGALGTGGFGARVEGDLSVTGGQSLYILVAGNGGSGDFDSGVGGAGGFNGGGVGGNGAANWGGGGGGGASDVRTTSTGQQPESLLSRLVVAAGGGGAGTYSGGSAGSPGSGDVGAVGGAGTAGAGGAGGNGTSAGAPGNIGVGGAGGVAAAVNTRGGGGGGGGLYGGGGAGAATASSGGGGGSSFIGTAANAAVTVDDTGVPTVTISYVPDASSGIVDAVVTMADSAVCLELSTSAIDFGTRQFGEVLAIATPSVGITNCGGISETILARGTDAVGPNAGWALVGAGSCAEESLVLDQYRLTLIDPNSFDLTPLTTTNQLLLGIGGGATAYYGAAIDTPCPGSTGAGTVMSMQITFVATE